jgi:tetratricopeptide (TPR) repeat protein
MNLIRVLLFISIGAALLLGLQANDSIATAYVRVSDQYRSTYALNEADQYLQPALLRQPWNAELYLRSSDIAFGLRDLDRSARQLDLADAAGAEPWAVYTRRAEIAEASNQFEIAATFWFSATFERSDNVSAFQRLIEANVRLGDFDRAANLALGWIVTSGNLPEARWAFAKLIALDDPISAKQYFDHLPATQVREFLIALDDPQSIDPAYRSVALGRAYLADNDVVLAARAFRMATELNPNYAEALAYYGFAQDQLGQDGGAYLDRALEIDRVSALALYFRGLHKIAQNDPAVALIDLQVAIDRDPQNYLVMIALGRAYSQQADFASAEKWLIAARDLKPNDGLSWQALCELYVGRGYGSLAQALATAQQLINLAPEAAGSHVWLGRAYLLYGNLQFAERELRQAVALDPQSASAHYFLGRFLKSDTAEGRLEFERALALDPVGQIGTLAKKELLLP